jgi:exonuclease III
MIKIVLFILIFIFNDFLFSQSLPIFLDGKTDDWNIPVPTYIDTVGDGNNYDFRYFSVTNDEEFLYIRLNLTPECKLLEDNSLALYIDGDNNINTGLSVNGVGAELEWDFGIRSGTFYKSVSTPITYADIIYRSLPTVTDTTYEIAIGRDALPNGTDLLFTSSTIKIFFRDNDTGGDWMPGNGETFIYTFDDTTQLPQLIPIEISKEDTTLLRVVDYNVLNDGLTDMNRRPYFERILQAINPDIICFNECFNSSETQVKTAISQMLPGTNWDAVKLDNGNVTVSRYQILQNWLVYPGHRITASLINLPDYFGTDLLTINAHLKCCGGETEDSTRQSEVDAIISFLLDVKSGNVDPIQSQTPFIILGDLNLVGLRQQLTTLVTGDIINTQDGGYPDWDGTPLEDLIAQQTDKRTAYTWRNDEVSYRPYPPSRLDFQIYSNSVMGVEKAFVLQTEVMSSERLSEYGLQQFDTRSASDHFPKVTDYSLNITSVVSENAKPITFHLKQNYPNPFNPNTVISWQSAVDGYQTLKIYDVLGNEITTLADGYRPAGEYKINFNGSGLSSGVYFYTLQIFPSSGSGKNYVACKKMLLLK